MSRCHACGLRNSECHVCVRMALAVGVRWRSVKDLGRRRVELKVWRRMERGLQVVEESVYFQTYRSGSSALGLQDLGIWR